MTRFYLKTPQSGAAVEQPLYVEQSIWHTSHRRGVHHAVFAPLHYEPNYAYPLVIWLHGPGDDERQLLRVMPWISMRNYVSIGPRGPRRASEGDVGYQWPLGDADVASAEQSVAECLEIAKEKFHVASHRVFLAGYQSGGTTAFRIGLKHPHRFAGLLSLGGPFPMENAPLARLEESRTLPLFIAQGRSSTHYPVEKTCDELRLFHAAGMHVTLRQYPCGDELAPRMLRDMNVWMMEQVTGVVTSDVQDITSYPSDEN